jgi:lipid II:glycine glycyltransferase (peptidoglycan interpeptide bridge formation enzyme)
MDRSALITRKHEVRRQLERAGAELARLQSAGNENAADPQRNRRRIAQLQQQIEQLMAEEYNLRLAIDRSAV